MQQIDNSKTKKTAVTERDDCSGIDDAVSMTNCGSFNNLQFVREKLLQLPESLQRKVAKLETLR